MQKKFIFLLQLVMPCFAMEEKSKWDAQLYDEHSKQQYEASIRHLTKLNLSSSDMNVIVELGCNTANISRTLAEEYDDKTFIGIDPEENAIDLARKKHEAQKNLVLMHDNAQRFNLKGCNQSLANLIICYHVLHWIPKNEMPKVFDNVLINLEKNGVIDISTSAKQASTGLTKAILRTILKPWWWRYLPSTIGHVIKGQNTLTLLTAPELRQFASNAGLQVEVCEEVEEFARFESKEEFCPWLTSILKPYGIDAMPKEHQASFVNEAADLYCKDYNPVNNGKIEYRFKIVHLKAFKS